MAGLGGLERWSGPGRARIWGRWRPAFIWCHLEALFRGYAKRAKWGGSQERARERLERGRARL